MVGRELKERNLDEKGLSSSPEREFCENGLFAPARGVFVNLEKKHAQEPKWCVCDRPKKKKKSEIRDILNSQIGSNWIDSSNFFWFFLTFFFLLGGSRFVWMHPVHTHKARTSTQKKKS